MLFEGVLSWRKLMAVITTINHLHVFCINMFINHFLPVMTVATLATRPVPGEATHFNLFPDLFTHSLLLFGSFHNHWNEQTRSLYISKGSGLLLMLRWLVLFQSMLGWREFKTYAAAVLYGQMLGVNMLLHDIMPSMAVRAFFAEPEPWDGIHLQFTSNQVVRKFSVLQRLCNCCWNTTN